MNFREFLQSLRQKRVIENEGDIIDGKPPGPFRPLLDRVICNPDDQDLVARIIHETNPWDVPVETNAGVPPLHVNVVWRTRAREEKKERYHL